MADCAMSKAMGTEHDNLLILLLFTVFMAYLKNIYLIVY